MDFFGLTRNYSSFGGDILLRTRPTPSLPSTAEPRQRARRPRRPAPGRSVVVARLRSASGRISAVRFQRLEDWNQFAVRRQTVLCVLGQPRAGSETLGQNSSNNAREETVMMEIGASAVELNRDRERTRPAGRPAADGRMELTGVHWNWPTGNRNWQSYAQRQPAEDSR